MELERVVQVDVDGRRFTFRVDHDPPLAFWRIEVDGIVRPLPLRVTGDETPDFFRTLVRTLLADGQLPRRRS